VTRNLKIFLIASGCLLLVVLMGLPMWSKGRERSQMQVPSRQPSETEASKGISNNIYFDIKELGIRMNMPVGLARDLIYEYDQWVSKVDGKTFKEARFSSKSIMKIDSKCLPRLAPLGAILETAGNKDQETDPILKGLLALIPVKQLANSYLYYSHPQYSCLSDKESQQKILEPELKQLGEAVDSIELLK
jgi:hypothetical protein